MEYLDIQILLCDIKGQNLDIIIPSHDKCHILINYNAMPDPDFKLFFYVFPILMS